MTTVKYTTRLDDTPHECEICGQHAQLTYAIGETQGVKFEICMCSECLCGFQGKAPKLLLIDLHDPLCRVESVRIDELKSIAQEREESTLTWHKEDTGEVSGWLILDHLNEMDFCYIIVGRHRELFQVKDGKANLASVATIAADIDWTNEMLVYAEDEADALRCAQLYSAGKMKPANLRWQGSTILALQTDAYLG